MKLYSLVGNVNGNDIAPSKLFKSRDDAIKYMFRFSHKKLVFNLEVEEINSINDDKHNLEYICNNDNSFVINRVIH